MKRILEKPTIETMINTAALALTATGVTMLTARDYFGLMLLCVGMGLEYFKYKGRQKKLW
jgi:hypothetical protein